MTRQRQSGCSRRREDPGVLGPQPSPRVARGRAGQPTPFAHGPHRNAQACDQQTHPAGKTCLWRRLQTTPIAGSPSLPALPPKAALPQTAQPQPLRLASPRALRHPDLTTACEQEQWITPGHYLARTWLGRVLMDGLGIGGHHKGRGGRPRAESSGRQVPV